MKAWFWVLLVVCAVMAPPSIPVVICSAIGYLMWQSRQDKKEAARLAKMDPQYLEDLARHKEEKKRLGL